MMRAESEAKQVPKPPPDERDPDPPKHCTVCNSPLLTTDRKPYVSPTGLCLWCEHVGSQG